MRSKAVFVTRSSIRIYKSRIDSHVWEERERDLLLCSLWLHRHSKSRHVSCETERKDEDCKMPARAARAFARREIMTLLLASFLIYCAVCMPLK